MFDEPRAESGWFSDQRRRLLIRTIHFLFGASASVRKDKERVGMHLLAFTKNRLLNRLKAVESRGMSQH